MRYITGNDDHSHSNLDHQIFSDHGTKSIRDLDKISVQRHNISNEEELKLNSTYERKNGVASYY